MDLSNSYNFLELKTNDEKYLKNRYKKIHKDNFYNYVTDQKKWSL